MRSKKLRKKVKKNTIPFWAQLTFKFEYHSTEVKKNQGRKNGGKFRFRQKKLRHRTLYQNLILVSVANTDTKLKELLGGTKDLSAHGSTNMAAM